MSQEDNLTYLGELINSAPLGHRIVVIYAGHPHFICECGFRGSERDDLVAHLKRAREGVSEAVATPNNVRIF
jgi:hypothetical protein